MNLNWHKGIRQLHRWTAVVFTLTVVVTFVALAQEDPIVWISYTPLPPLFVLLFSGLFLFAVPYAAKWRRRRNASVAG
ncbi:hypothetical protein Val02_17920 [Virgisporangium aliadipatigenens]|uniref:Transmembrane protein n=1 Tax=Virgisporangium aliadipatigenens TaxID=741659 RepID=A0A8J4DPG5_9ACTN|nr:hypothetical protein [Virgisporangium aliadipatigenens]GIJ44906.1 hypothetical protein Val02_17920 [Virgisporangium aliadipatigenens]